MMIPSVLKMIMETANASTSSLVCETKKLRELVTT